MGLLPSQELDPSPSEDLSRRTVFALVLRSLGLESVGQLESNLNGSCRDLTLDVLGATIT